MGKGFAPGFRFWLLALCILLGYGAIGYRLVELHALKRDALLQEAQDRRFRIFTTEPRRGDILDANMELLATSRTFVEVGFDPTLFRSNDKAKLPQLAALLEAPLEHVEKLFADAAPGSRSRWKLLSRYVEEPVYEKIRALRIRGVYGSPNFRRVYPKEGMAAHALGYVDQQGRSVSGVERAYDFFLKGQKGWKEAEVRGGEELAQFRRRHIEAKEGMSVALSIDAYVQYTIEEELARIASQLKPEWASIIVSDPYTGYLLGIANYPSFDPNRYYDFELPTHKNRAITDPIEPGSTFKIVAASAALEERRVSLFTEFDCSIETVVMPGGYRARLPNDSRPHGILSVEQIVTKSSNRGAAHLGMLLGEKGFFEYVRRYGFGERTGFDIDQESRGILAPVSKWDGLTLTRMPMGHAVGATPLQMHYAMAAVANGGVLMRPQVVTSILDTETRSPIMAFGPLPRRRVISMDTARSMAGLLEKTVAEGTARSAKLIGYHVAGKTGTSQKIVDGRYSSNHHVGSFTGFFPAHDPALAITVVVDGARTPGVAYGGIVAAPAFKRVASKLIPYYAISRSQGSPALASRQHRSNWTWRN